MIKHLLSAGISNALEIPKARLGENQKRTIHVCHLYLSGMTTGQISRTMNISEPVARLIVLRVSKDTKKHSHFSIRASNGMKAAGFRTNGLSLDQCKSAARNFMEKFPEIKRGYGNYGLPNFGRVALDDIIMMARM